MVVMVMVMMMMFMSGVTAVLTLSAISMDSRSDLPKVHYATALDWFIIISFLYCLASILEFAGVHYFTKVSRTLLHLSAKLLMFTVRSAVGKHSGIMGSWRRTRTRRMKNILMMLMLIKTGRIWRTGTTPRCPCQSLTNGPMCPSVPRHLPRLSHCHPRYHLSLLGVCTR